MCFKLGGTIRIAMLGLIICVLAGTFALQAQTKQLLQWSSDLASLKNASPDVLTANKPAIVMIRKGIDLWLKMHPSTTVKLQPAPAEPWNAETIKAQVSSINEAIQAILKEDPSQPFNLGVTTVSVTSEASPLAPVTESIDRTEIQNRQATTVAAAIDYLPGLTLERTASRNEMKVRLRGYTSQGQFPLYLDGIPIQVAYDGRLDFSRFLTSDIAEINVAKGYSSPLMGANNLGGSINLVSRQPEKKFEANATVGTGSGDLFMSSLQLGSRLEKFFFQGSVDWLQQDFIPLSGNFPLQEPLKPYSQTTYERNQSDTQDAKYSGRIGFTPKGQDQYVFSYINQKGVKSTPMYAGPNENPSGVRFWKWPFWNKYSYYVLTNTGLGEKSSIKFRLFYDQFKNGLRNYDDYTYATQLGKSAFYTEYDDHTGGASVEFATRIVPRNALGASFFFKDDTHKSTDFIPKTPTELDRSQTFSLGFQDVIAITSHLRATFGFSADHLKGLHATQYNKAKSALLGLTCNADPTNTSLRGCLPNVWTYNPQASVSYNFATSNTIFMTFADRGRFPLLSENYSTKFRSSVANPDLKPEHSRNWNIGYSRYLGAKTLAQIEYFHNDMRDSIHSVSILDTQGVCPDSKIKGYCGKFVNIAKESHQGAEISIRSTPIARLTLDANYSYINRNLDYQFSDMPDVSQVNTQIDLLMGMPKHKFIFNATGELPRKILALATIRYEGGITLQDTTYTPVHLPYGSSFGTMDIGTVVPIAAGFSVQAGIKNLFDRDYYYSVGYPEAGRNWYFNGRYKF